MGDTDEQSGGGRLALLLVGAAVLAGLGLLAWGVAPRPPEPDPPPAAAEPESFPPPPYSPSRYLNTGPEAKFVGSAACAACHPKNHESYRLTAHSRALSEPDPAAEPPDASFHHAPSGRSYRVYRRDGRLRHEEVLRTADGTEIARTDLPLRYLVGSGHFTRSYLVEVDGFLHESPVTWYASRQQWGMSPGYDARTHWGFERPAAAECLACHAGRVGPVPGATHKVNLHEMAIGCESCHGPGSLHADRHRDRTAAPAGEDLTIVHPGRLPRDRLEDVCAACHLSSAAAVPVRGRGPTDFRPGMPLTDYRTDYRFDTGGDRMTVVGHVEQLRQSACYQKADGLTCVTCHDPHARAKPADPVAYYRQKCLDCHAAKGCRLDPGERVKKEPADNCAACHMPRGGTDIPHVAFTHHRIGRHTPAAPPDPNWVPDLVPAGDVSRLPPRDRDRNLGLAYLTAARDPAHARFAGAFRARARALLEPVEAAGLCDPETDHGLAEAVWEADPARGAALLRRVLEAKGAGADVRALALANLAAWEVRALDFESAAARLTELTTLRRRSEDWYLLGMCHLMRGRPRDALPALEQALAIRGDRHLLHAALAEAYRRTGDAARAKAHHEKAVWLRDHRRE